MWKYKTVTTTTKHLLFKNLNFQKWKYFYSDHSELLIMQH